MARVVARSLGLDHDSRELSWDASEALRYFVEQYSDDTMLCRDPFDILAELEEELGEPLCRN